MKIIISISMSFLFLFQGIAANMEVCKQIEKISDFIAHYQQHNSFNGDSFFEFVYEDLIADNHNSNDHHKNSEEDNTLIHSHQCCQHFMFFVPFEPSLLNVAPSEEQPLFNYYTFNIHPRYLESPFQPPKV